MIHRHLVSARARRGFSLVEILVAVLLIGILMAVGASRLLGARENAADSAAQQQLTQVALAAETSYMSSDSFANATADKLEDDLPDIQLTATTAAIVADTGSVREVAINVPTTPSPKLWTAAALGGEGRCWFIQIDYTAGSANAGDRFAYTGPPAGGTANTSCNPANMPAAGAATSNDFEFPAAE